LIAAPLKPDAQLKRFLAMGEFRDQLIAAPLKRFLDPPRFRLVKQIPRSIDRGPIEARLVPAAPHPDPVNSAIN